jgi:uncharacterized protein YndB with AHSA1/START domain
MPAYDLTRLECRIWISVSPHEVFDSWARAEHLAKWFQRSAKNFSDGRTIEGLASSGDSYEWKMSHGHVSRGNYLEVQPDKLVRLTFGHGTGMTFTVRFEPLEGGTLVRLTHENIPDGDVETHVDIKTGWTFFLTNLKAWHEHKVDLREHAPQRIRMGIVNI